MCINNVKTCEINVSFFLKKQFSMSFFYNKHFDLNLLIVYFFKDFTNFLVSTKLLHKELFLLLIIEKANSIYYEYQMLFYVLAYNKLPVFFFTLNTVHTQKTTS